MQDVKATDQTASRENAGRTKMQDKIAARENAMCENAGRPTRSHPAFSSVHIMATGQLLYSGDTVQKASFCISLMAPPPHAL